MPYLPELLGPHFRIDHDYCLFMRRGDARGGACTAVRTCATVGATTGTATRTA